MRNLWGIGAFIAVVVLPIASTVVCAVEHTQTVNLSANSNDPTYPTGNVKLKSPWMVDSDTWRLQVRMNQTPRAPLPGLGWAGFRATVHNLDPNEVDIDFIFPDTAGIHIGAPVKLWLRTLPDQFLPIPVGPSDAVLGDPFGPRSNNVGSVPRVVSFLWPHLGNNPSGIDLTPPATQPVMVMILHAKNTNAGRNSTFNDVSIKFSDIWHFRDNLFPGGSTSFELPASYNLWVASNVANSQALHFDGISAQTLPFASKYRLPNSVSLYNNNGHWLDLQQTRVFHRFANDASAYIANPLMVTLSLGIEHVPEPTTLVLFGGGAACVVMAMRARKMRRAA